MGETSFSYKVTASSDAGEYTFMGVLKYSPVNAIVDVEVSGPGVVTVEAGPASQPTTWLWQAGPSVPPRSDAGGEVEVTIQASGYGFGGQVVETLPAGFSYVNGSVNPSNINVREEDQDLKFTLLGETSFSYKVTASSDAGEYTFMGVLKYSPVDVIVDVEVGGVSAVTVEAAAPPPTGDMAMAGRSISPATVDTGGEVEVTIQASGYGFGAGQVVETLPAGFSYVNGSVNPSNINVREEDQDLKFTLLGETSFSYKVTASSDAGEYTFMGVLKYSPVDVIVDVGVGGASSVTVRAPATSASRSFSPASVALGGEVEVTIMASAYGFAGQVVETLPNGFTYVEDSVSPSTIGVDVEDQ